MKVLTILGTRPEAIKLAPVIRELKNQAIFESKVLVTGQHREMLDQALAVFDIKPDFDLKIMRRNQDLFDITARLLSGVKTVLQQEQPDFVLVQGDTTTTFGAALASFYQKIPIGHIEAGLRSFDNRHPFPEEINRKLTSILTDIHFVPTKRASENLLREGVPAYKIFQTGNPIIDALFLVLENKKPNLAKLPTVADGKRLILITAHRRENWGEPLEDICRAVNLLIQRHPDIEVVFPVHLNPKIKKMTSDVLGDNRRVNLIEPCDYATFVHLMNKSYLILTDSGGIQEEAVSLSKPVLVMREVTERPESIEVGTSRLVGTDPETIAAAASRLLERKDEYERARRTANPFGDGKAAHRIVSILTKIARSEILLNCETDSKPIENVV